MTSTIFSLWYALFVCSFGGAPDRSVPRVEYAEVDGWHYVVRHQNHFLVMQAGSPNRFETGDRLKNLRARTGEQWILVNETPNKTSVLVRHVQLDYDQARIISASLTLRQIAATN